MGGPNISFSINGHAIWYAIVLWGGNKYTLVGNGSCSLVVVKKVDFMLHGIGIIQLLEIWGESQPIRAGNTIENFSD